MAKIVKMEVLVKKTIETTVCVNVEVPDDFDKKDREMLQKIQDKGCNIAMDCIEFENDELTAGETEGVTACDWELEHIESEIVKIFDENGDEI